MEHTSHTSHGKSKGGKEFRHTNPQGRPASAGAASTKGGVASAGAASTNKGGLPAQVPLAPRGGCQHQFMYKD
jgi:hypothetical protein